MIYLFDRFINWINNLFILDEEPEPDFYDVELYKRDTAGSLTKMRRWYGKTDE